MRLQQHRIANLALVLSMVLAPSYTIAAVDMDDRAGAMPSAMFPGRPMSVEGSGSGWLPRDTPMDAAHAHTGSWMFMLHGAMFPRYTAQNINGRDRRDGFRFDAPGWAMGSASRGLNDRFNLSLRCMMSPDPVIEGGGGYPLLFQTGETWRGSRLVDRQHPHELFGELSAAIGIALGERSGAFAYIGYPGEPALGPVAFMHRPSCASNPDAPLSHHWQDATHISFGVVTAGCFWRAVKLDASIFNGKEPNEDRYGFDPFRLSSTAVRLTLNPSDGASFQLSHAYLREPEALEPGEDATRTTASVTVVRPLAHAFALITTMIWGRNAHSGGGIWGNDGSASHSALLESELRIQTLRVYTRCEYVEKSAAELVIPGPGDSQSGIRTITLGLCRDVASLGALKLALGVQGSSYDTSPALQATYGRRPFSAQMYCRLSLAEPEPAMDRGEPAHIHDHD